MNLFTVGLAMLILTQIPGINSQNSFACKRVQAIIESSPGRQCLLISDNENDCMAILENDTTITLKINDELLQAVDMCKEDISRDHTKIIRDHLVQQQKKDKEICSHSNLNKNDAYSCNQMGKDIQDLDKRLYNKKNSKKSTQR